MTTNLTVVMLIAVIALIFVDFIFVRRVGEVEDFTFEAVAKLSNAVATHEQTIGELEAKIEAMREKVDELPVEDIEAAFKAEKAWNEGVQNILNYHYDAKDVNKNE